MDPTRRYILAADAPYVKNLAALWAIDPMLAAQIESLCEPGYCIEPSKAGPPTVTVKSADGRALCLHSRYQPIEEASRLIDGVNVDQRIAFSVHGLGLGYALELLFDRASDEAIFFVFEPDLVLLRTAFEHRDLSRLIESGRVHFFWKADKSELFVRLTPQMAMLSMGIEAVLHAPSIQLHPDFHKQVQAWMVEFASFCRTNINTLILNGRRTAENITRNLGWYAATAPISRLKDRYKGKPAIVVSAGPSLRKNKHLLKDAAGKAVLIAVQTTLQPLVEMGVEPQFVTSLDYHDICTRFFERLPATLRTELVAEPKATNKIFSLHPGPLSLLGNDFAEKMLREMKLGKTGLPSGSTVAHLAFYLAEHLGCDPIIFVGQDLGFSDGLLYAPGTSYEDVWRPELGRFCTMEMKQWEQIVRERHILRRIKDYQGNPIYTEERLFTYLQQFERDFARSKSRIIDATEGGAAKLGAQMMPLARAIAEHCTEPLPVLEDECLSLRWDRLGECISSLGNRCREAQQIEEIARDTLPLLEEVRDHLDDQPRVNRVIARIDALRARMDTLGPCYELIMQLTQLSELQRFQRDRQISASKVSGAERQRQQVTRDIENVRSIMDAAAEFQRLVREVIADFVLQHKSTREAA